MDRLGLIEMGNSSVVDDVIIVVVVIGKAPGVEPGKEPGDQARGVDNNSLVVGTSDPLSLKQMPVSTERLSHCACVAQSVVKLERLSGGSV